jgi:hypothetical protein
MKINTTKENNATMTKKREMTGIECKGIILRSNYD